MKTFVNKAGVLLVGLVIAGKVILFPDQALANQDYNPNTFELNIKQTEFYKPEQMSLEEITDKISGYTTADRVLIAGMFYGVDYAREQTEKGMTNPFEKKFDYVFAPNPNWNIILSPLRAVLTNLGNQLIEPKDNYKILKNLG